MTIPLNRGRTPARFDKARPVAIAAPQAAGTMRLVALTLLIGTIVFSVAAQATLSPRAACGVYDAHLLTLQEDAAAAGHAEAVLVSVALVARARALCAGGQAGAALDLYAEAETSLPRILGWLR